VEEVDAGVCARGDAIRNATLCALAPRAIANDVPRHWRSAHAHLQVTNAPLDAEVRGSRGVTAASVEKRTNGYFQFSRRRPSARFAFRYRRGSVRRAIVD
jgi:hypothetical protein